MNEPASDADASAPSPETAEIRSKIEQTRAGMSQTIDAIQERLSPSQIAASAADTAKEATARGVMSLTRHPIPLALASAAGAALIVMTARRRHGAMASVPAPGGRTHLGGLLAVAGLGMACWGAWRARQAAPDTDEPWLTTWTEIEPLVDDAL
jgi:hypothetical protein